VITTSDGVRIFHTEQGSGEPLLLIPGTTATHAVWEPQMAAFSERFRTIRIDQRGAGAAGVPRDPQQYSIGRMAQDIAEVLDALEIDSVHIGGISMGGAVALRFALDHPDRVRTIHVVGAWARTDEFLRRIFFEPLAGALDRSDFRGSFRYALGLMMSPSYLETREPAQVARVISEVFVAHPVKPDGFRGHLAAGAGIDELSRLHEIQAPTLVVTSEHDANIPPRYGEQIAREIPHAQLEVLRGPTASHVPNIEMPDEFNATVLTFLSAHSSGGPA
jgi:3-oxoadipate enol-lactonase